MRNVAKGLQRAPAFGLITKWPNRLLLNGLLRTPPSIREAVGEKIE